MQLPLVGCGQSFVTVFCKHIIFAGVESTSIWVTCLQLEMGAMNYMGVFAQVLHAR
jgi:hypothetical protein